MTKLLYAASAAAILTVAGHLPAMAQSSTTGAMSPTITCRDISTMDRDMARSVVFYVSGFEAASDQMQNQASATGASGTSGTSSTTGSTSADAGTSGTTDTTGSTSADAGTSGTTGSSGSSSTAADAGSTTSGSSSSDVTGSTSSAGGTTDAGGTSGSSSTASGASGGASSAVVAQLPGFSGVDIDKIMSDCASSPDRQLSEMIGQAGSSTTGTTTP